MNKLGNIAYLQARRLLTPFANGKE